MNLRCYMLMMTVFGLGLIYTAAFPAQERANAHAQTVNDLLEQLANPHSSGPLVIGGEPLSLDRDVAQARVELFVNVGKALDAVYDASVSSDGAYDFRKIAAALRTVTFGHSPSEYVRCTRNAFAQDRTALPHVLLLDSSDDAAALHYAAALHKVIKKLDDVVRVMTGEGWESRRIVNPMSGLSGAREGGLPVPILLSERFETGMGWEEVAEGSRVVRVTYCAMS